MQTKHATIAPAGLSKRTVEILDRMAAKFGYRRTSDILAGKRPPSPPRPDWTPWWVQQ